MTLTERTAYIKGLCEGMGLDKKDTPEAKIINALLELCEEMALEIEDIEYDIGELADYCEELDEDLGDVEEVLLDMDDEDEDWDDEDECDGDCDACDICGECEYCDDEDYYEILCPSCGETVCFDESAFDEETLTCPACGSEIGEVFDEDEIDLEPEDEE
ncbi:MAG: hypothetical protein E7611_02975 [Ruminococcaceae bacterium]|nr:hypothetical protein [Oscillospiraceae bacterium]